MGDLSMLTRDAVRELDRRAIHEVGVPSSLLMENAGRACADEALRLLAGRDGTAIVLCGPGNNGGDGLVIARTLVNRGRAASVIFIGPHEKLDAGSEDFELNLRLWRRHGGEVKVAASPAEIAALEPLFADAPLIVDALFGTGLTRELGDPWADAIRRVNESKAPVLAVDLPSGLDADMGEILGAAVRADVTVTFVACKPGLKSGAGPAHAGRIVVAEIGIPRFLIEEALEEG